MATKKGERIPIQVSITGQEESIIQEYILASLSQTRQILLDGEQGTLDDRRLIAVSSSPLDYAWNLHEAGTELKLVDEKLSEYDENEVRRVMKVAPLCTKTSPMQDPSKSRVVTMLSGDIEARGAITRPEYLKCSFKGNIYVLTMHLKQAQESSSTYSHVD